MAKTKIVVIQLKEIIYTVIFAALGILLILLLVFMFTNKDKGLDDGNAQLYVPGMYTSSTTLNGTAINLKVFVDENHISSVSIENIDEVITTMYPLVEPSLEAINAQLLNGVPIDQVETLENNQFTQQLLIDGIKSALAKATIPKE